MNREEIEIMAQLWCLGEPQAVDHSVQTRKNAIEASAYSVEAYTAACEALFPLIQDLASNLSFVVNDAPVATMGFVRAREALSKHSVLLEKLGVK